MLTNCIFRYYFICFLLALFFSLLSNNFANSDETFAPKDFVKNVYSKIDAISSANLTKPERISKMLDLFDDHVDILFISRAVLGSNWKKASRDQRLRFSSAFKAYMAKKYGSQFKDFNSGKLKIENVVAQGSKGFIIQSKILTEKSKAFDIAWQVVISKDDLKLINIKFEGISMIHSERTEIRNLIKSQSGSMEGLISELGQY